MAIRSTHAAIGHPQLKRVASAAKSYGYGFLSEPPGKVEKEKMAERIFNDACCGVSAYFDYPGNPHAAGDAYFANIGVLDGSQTVVDIAVLFPEADHFLRIEKGYPDLWFETLNPLRDVADYDIVDERMIADGILRSYRLLIFYGYPLMEAVTVRCLNGFLARGGAILWFQHATSGQSQPEPDRPNALRRTVEGQVIALELPPTEAGGGLTALRISPHSEEALQAIERAHRTLLAARDLSDLEIDLLTRRDSVWAALFDHRILLYNAHREPAALPSGASVKNIAVRQILVLPRRSR